MSVTELETKRLLLRQWKEEDLPNFAKLNSDPIVMEYFPRTLSRAESDKFAERCRSLIAEQRWGLWATELKIDGNFIGFVGLNSPKETIPFSPCVEIGWRLLRKYWGNAYATEAARESLRFGFNILGLSEIVSFTSVSNYRSRSVMQRIGMVNTKQNFQHQNLANSHPLSEHVLYKINETQWRGKTLNSTP
ncbi:MAG: GNAT family N-acetyltransferase [Okeania sp. SIO2D1]|nr:GNAT family N-acetyltransferase [Okeania sp. SIO2D1]